MKRAGLESACWPAFSFCWQSLQDNLNMSCTQDWVHQNDVRKRYYCYNSPQLLRESARIHPSISLIFAGKIPEDSPKSGPGYPLGASRSPEARIMDQMGHHVGMKIWEDSLICIFIGFNMYIIYIIHTYTYMYIYIYIHICGIVSLSNSEIIWTSLMKWFVNRDSPNLYTMPGSKSMAQLSWENKGPVSLDSLAISTLHPRVPELALRSNDLYDINRAAQHVSSTRSGLPSWGTSVWNTPKGYASTTLNVTDGYQSLSQPCKPERLGDKTDSKPMTFFFLRPMILSVGSVRSERE